jgi:hypothetical protein
VLILEGLSRQLNRCRADRPSSATAKVVELASLD